jgi:hypothetical protein
VILDWYHRHDAGKRSTRDAAVPEADTAQRRNDE